MDVLPLNFRILTYCGFWIENSSGLFLLRRLWGFLIAANIFYFTIVQLIEIYHLRSNIEEVVDVMFLTVTYVLLCLKILNYFFHQKSLLDLLGNFRNKMCQSVSLEEELILQKYVLKIRNIFQRILGLSQATGVMFCILPFITLRPEDYVLPFKTFQFYDDTSIAGFVITCAIQCSAIIIGIFINVSMDTMIYGFIILTTSQFELINFRITKSTEETNKILLRQCIIHHVFMTDTVRQIQNVYIGIIGPLFIFSLITLCVSIFQMAQNDIISFDFLLFAMYLSCMLCQVFLYCWYGNELKLQSKFITNTIGESDWTVWDLREKKTLQILMMSAQKGCDISWKGQCSLSLDTFVWIMKTSYSAFNLLQQASIK